MIARAIANASACDQFWNDYKYLSRDLKPHFRSGLDLEGFKRSFDRFKLTLLFVPDTTDPSLT
jgi:hypothetical protein